MNTDVFMFAVHLEIIEKGDEEVWTFQTGRAKAAVKTTFNSIQFYWYSTFYN